MGRSFKGFINEGSHPYLDELETHLLKLKPKDYIKKIKKIRYKSNRPNFKIYEDQNGEGAASNHDPELLYDLLRFYTYNGKYMTSKVRDYINKELPDSKYTVKNMDFKYDLGDGLYFVGEYLFGNEVPKSLMFGNSIDPATLMSDFDTYFDLYIIDSKTNKKQKFSWSTYRTRKKISPDDVITKRELLETIKNKFMSNMDKPEDLSEYRYDVTLAMVDDVIGKYYIKDNSEIVDQIKKDLQKAKTGKEAIKVLNRYNFKGIPDEDVVQDLIKNNYKVSYSNPDKWGHTTGITYEINFQARYISHQTWSSDD